MSQNNIEEIKKIRRVSDMMVTGHTCLHERYKFFNLWTEILIFSTSIFLAVFAFSSDEILTQIFGIWSKLTIGFLSIVTLILAYFADKLDWKIKAEKHCQAAKEFFALKKEAQEILSKLEAGESFDSDKFTGKYNLISDAQIKIPENSFLKCKKHHLSKVEISKWLDEHPGGSILIFKIKRFFRDNK